MLLRILLRCADSLELSRFADRRRDPLAERGAVELHIGGVREKHIVRSQSALWSYCPGQGRSMLARESVDILTDDDPKVLQTHPVDALVNRRDELNPPYVYAPDCKADRSTPISRGFKGVLKVDGYGDYRVLAERDELEFAFCWSHVRRRFDELAAAGSAKPGTCVRPCISYDGGGA